MKVENAFLRSLRVAPFTPKTAKKQYQLEQALGRCIRQLDCRVALHQRRVRALAAAVEARRRGAPRTSRCKVVEKSGANSNAPRRRRVPTLRSSEFAASVRSRFLQRPGVAKIARSSRNATRSFSFSFFLRWCRCLGNLEMPCKLKVKAVDGWTGTCCRLRSEDTRVENEAQDFRQEAIPVRTIALVRTLLKKVI